MGDPLLGGLGFAAVLALIALGVPVAVAMAAVGALGFWWINGWLGLGFVLGAAPYEAIFPYSLSVVPLFVMMGVFAARAGLSKSLFDAVNGFVGHLRGGLAIATVGACALFGAICGSSLATVATMGRVALPEMRRHGYADSLSAASVAAGGTLGVLIPPSILLVIFGLLTETSIGALFIGALVPGVVATVLYALGVVAQTRLRPDLAPAGERHGWAERLGLLRRVGGIAALFVLVIGGIYAGFFSPTEAAAVGAAGAFIIALLAGRMTLAVIGEVVAETAAMTGMIFLILIGASLFNYFLETTNLPVAMVGLIESADLGPFAVLVLILVGYVILGCFLDSLSMILLTVPFLAPVAVALGYDLVWFGVLVVTVAEIGLITPPVGMNLFVVQGIDKALDQRVVVRGILPFILADLLRLALLVAFPALVLWLPGQMN